MAKPTDIRRTILVHRVALELLGSLRTERAVIEAGKGAQREVTAYWLNEEQATYVTMHCKTPTAQAVKVQLVKVFTAWSCHQRPGGACTVDEGAARLHSFRIGQVLMWSIEMSFFGNDHHH